MTSKRFFELEARCKKLRKAKMARYIVFIFTLCLCGLGGYYYFFELEKHLAYETVQISTPIEPNVKVLPIRPSIEASIDENLTEILKNEAEKKQSYDTLFLQPKVNYKTHE